MPTATNYREAALRQLPAMSPMLMRLIGKLTRAEVDSAEVCSLIARDTVLCGQVLRAVNSARYARHRRVDRIDDAVLYLGIGKLRKLALGLSLSNIFGRTKTAACWSPLRFHLHSAGVAMMAEILSGYVSVPHGEAAFVAGLLHDVGKFAMALNLREEYTLVLNRWSSTGRTIVECETEILGIDHAEIGALMLARWRLSPELQRAVFYHHRPEGGVSLNHLLQLSDSFARYLGITVEQPLSEDKPDFLMELPGHELPVAEILAKFEAEYAELNELFNT